MRYSISLWNYIHYFPLKKGGTNFAFDRGLGSLEEVVAEGVGERFRCRAVAHLVQLGVAVAGAQRNGGKTGGPLRRGTQERLKTMLKDVRASWHTGNEDTIEEYRRQIDTVSCVGCEILVVHAGNLFLGGPDPDFGFAPRCWTTPGRKG